MRTTRWLPLLGLAFSATLASCGGSDLSDEDAVKLIFTDFQPTIAKIVAEGYAAKSAATSGANITTPPTANGDVEGVMTVGGKVAQSSGLNQNFTLWVQLDGPYADTNKLQFATDDTSDATKLQFPVQIVDQPTDNRMSSTVNGALHVTGEVEGTATFAVNIATDLNDDDTNPTPICSHVTGTVAAKKTQSFDFVLPLDTSGLDPAQVTKCQTL